MALQFITVDRIRLAFAEQNPDAEKVIFFIHGNSSSSEAWQPQFASALLSEYCLIAVDLPGHAQSASSPDCSLPELGRLMAMTINGLVDGRDYIIAGLSLGVNIMAEMQDHLLYHPKGLVVLSSCAIGGAYTMDLVFMPGIDMQPSFTDEVSKEDLGQYWTKGNLCVHDADNAKYKSFEKDYYAVRDNFRSKMFAAFVAGQVSDEIALFRQTDVPMLIIFGGEEKVCNIHYLDNAGLPLWQDKVHIIPGAGHFINIDLPEPANQLLASFAADLF